MSSLDAVNTLQGYSSDSQDPRTNKVTAALNPLDPYRTGLDVWAHAATSLIATDAAEAGSTQFRVNATAHSAKVGDIIRFTSGTHSGLECPVLVVSANYFDLSLTLSAVVGTGDTFEIRRRTSLSVSSSGGLSLADGAKVQGLYPDASLSLSNPIPFAGKDVFTGQTRIPVIYNNLGIDFLLVTPVDPNLSFPNFRAGTGEAFSLVASPDDTKGNSRYLNIDSTTRSAFVQGSIAHDAADSTNPIKIGGKASTSTPTAVANGDRVDAYFDDRGRLTVRADSLPQADTSSATIPARGKIAAASLTNSYASLLSMGGAAKIISIFNSTDQPVLFSLDNGTTDSIELDAYESITLDLVAAGLTVASSTISAKYVSTAPAVGSVRANVVR